tara:strand:+ start:1317 stop:1475 length:159 start_codon:yes stop_codon:yes gene_type:complete
MIMLDNIAEDMNRAMIEEEITSCFEKDLELKNLNNAESIPNENTGIKKANIV